MTMPISLKEDEKHSIFYQLNLIQLRITKENTNYMI